MNDTRRARSTMFVRYSCAAALILVAGLLSAAGRDSVVAGQTAATLRLAVVPGEGERAPKAGVMELLTAELAKRDGIVLLEREEVRRILAEQKLTAAGLTDRATAAKLGGLLAVDLFAVLERVPEAKPALCRVQAIEARTGIILAGRFMDEKDPAADAAAAMDGILLGVAKYRVPKERCHYVCVLGVGSEEPGRSLDGLAKALHMFLANDLNLSPEIRMLDREHLDRLKAEEKLTDAEVDLRASAVLVDCGLQRVPGREEIRVAVALRPLNGGEMWVRFEIPRNDVATIRRTLAEKTLAALGSAPPAEGRPDAKREAVILSTRAKLLLAHGQWEEALRLAEAAHALAPSQETRRRLALALNNYASHLGVSKPSTDDLLRKLSAELRDTEIRLELCEEHAKLLESGRTDDDRLPEVAGAWGDAAYPDRPAVQDLVKECIEMEFKALEFKLAFYARHSAPTKWWQAMDDDVHRRLRAQTPEQFSDNLRRFVERAMHAPTNVANREASRDLLCKLTRKCYSLPYMALSKVPARPAKDGSKPLEWMYRHEDPVVALAGHAIRAYLSGNQDPAIEREAIAFCLKRLPLDHPDRQVAADGHVADLLGFNILHSGAIQDFGEKKRYYHTVLDPILDEGNGQRLANWLWAMGDWLRVFEFQTPEPEFRTCLERVAAVLSTVPDQDSISLLTRDIEQRLAAIKGSVTHVEDLWRNFDIREFKLAPERMAAGQFVVLGQARNRILFACREREGPGNRTPRVVAAWDYPQGPFTHLGILDAADEPWCATQSGDCTFVGTPSGLLVFERGQRTVFAEDRGLPARHVQTIAQHAGLVYLGLVEMDKSAPLPQAGALAVFDPNARTFTLLASSRSNQRRNGLDGRFAYSIDSMLWDGKRDCLWLAVTVHNAADFALTAGTGLWRYRPADGTIEQVCKTRSAEASSLAVRGDIVWVDTRGCGLKGFNPERGNLTGVWISRGFALRNESLMFRAFGFLGTDVLAQCASREVRLVVPGKEAPPLSKTTDGQPIPVVNQLVQVDDVTVLLANKDGRLWTVRRKVKGGVESPWPEPGRP